MTSFSIQIVRHFKSTEYMIYWSRCMILFSFVMRLRNWELRIWWRALKGMRKSINCRLRYAHDLWILDLRRYAGVHASFPSRNWDASQRFSFSIPPATPTISWFFLACIFYIHLNDVPTIVFHLNTIKITVDYHLDWDERLVVGFGEVC